VTSAARGRIHSVSRRVVGFECARIMSVMHEIFASPKLYSTEIHLYIYQSYLHRCSPARLMDNSFITP
jgi:hypothetical protein